MKLNIKFLVTLALLAGFSSIQAQTVEQPAPPSEHKAISGDPIRDLNLTPEQREQIRSIREQSRIERAAINQHVRDAHRALDESLDLDVPDQALVEQRIREVSTAQADAMRMRILTEVKIRQVLNNEQRAKLRTLRRQAIELSERRVRGPEERQRRLEQRSLRLQERRDRIRPMRPQNPNQRPQEW